jgi:hypothetical protein
MKDVDFKDAKEIIEEIDKIKELLRYKEEINQTLSNLKKNLNQNLIN